MTTKAKIATQALSFLNENTIIFDFEQGTNSQEIIARKFYDSVLENLLIAIDWGFCGRLKYLSDVILLSDIEKIGGWEYSLKFPNDVLKIRSITDNQMPIDYQVGNSENENITVIYCNTNTVLLNYTALITDITLYPPYFRNVLSWGLAKAMAMEITSSTEMLTYVEQNYNKALDKAKTIDSNTTKNKINNKVITNKFIKARQGR